MNFRKFLSDSNVWLYRVSGGRLGNKMAGQSVLLVHHTGRKSGKAYVTPMNYYRDGKDYLVVASNWGQDEHPSWYYNLKHTPDAVIEVDGKPIAVKVSEAQDETYERLWKMVQQKNTFYVQYEQKTPRHIPILLLTPQENA